MPKKGKAKKKAKTKGKKGTKGKRKGSKKSEGVDKEAILKDAVSTAKIWEARYNATERSRQEYRQNTQRLIAENDTLQSAISKTEKDTIEVITFLKKKDVQKDEELSFLRGTVRDLRQGLNKEWEQKETELNNSLGKLQTDLTKKDEEIVIMQGELKTMKEFRRKRAELQERLETMQETLDSMKHEHRQQLINLEEKFFEEKLRLQKEANRRIEELASKAHTEAVSNLDEKTQMVYRENIVISEALSLHMSEEQNLRKEKESLEIANRQLAAEKELSQQLAQGKVQEAHRQKKQIQELEGKVTTLEESLTVMVKEFEIEREKIDRDHKREMVGTKNELTILKRQCELQKRETSHIRRLAQHLLDQRTDVEQFFLEALGQVKKEIAANRLQYRRNAEKIYYHQLMDAANGKRDFPPIRTFHPNMASTNSIYHDMIMAEKWDTVDDNVDIADLTWEQKEQVLRLLFAKINQKEEAESKHKNTPLSLPPPPPAPSLEDKLPAITDNSTQLSTLPPSEDNNKSVFITQNEHQPKTTTIKVTT